MWKHFGYGQLWPLWPKSGWIVYAGFDFLHPFQLHFSKEGMDHTVPNQPRPDLDGLVRVWANTSGPEASWCAGIIWPGFWQEATGRLPVSDLVPFFHRRPRYYCAKPAQIWFSSGWLCQVLARRIRSGRSKPGCMSHLARFWPTFPSQSGPDANPIRHVCWAECRCHGGR